MMMMIMMMLLLSIHNASNTDDEVYKKTKNIHCTTYNQTFHNIQLISLLFNNKSNKFLTSMFIFLFFGTYLHVQ